MAGIFTAPNAKNLTGSMSFLFGTFSLDKQRKSTFKKVKKFNQQSIEIF